MKEKGFLRFILEILIVAAVTLGTIALCDTRRVFAADESNNHIDKKWHYLYLYAEQDKPIDILVVGNSHAYTGLIPEIIKDMLGARCFILAAPGVQMDECSYMLEEALALIKPKLVILETYPINDYVQKNLSPSDLSDQFTSFASRRNLKLKLKSMFKLFKLDDIPFAWSSTLRNHDIFFDDPKLLEYNLKHPSAPEYDPNEEYLGRFARFESGLTEETLNRYRTDGAPVDGSKIKPGPDAIKATERMLEMCKEKDIPTAFLTVPMYREHVANAEQWHDNLKPIVGDVPWLDLQLPSYNRLFGPQCFEDTYEVNQHQSIEGAKLTSTLLGRSIRIPTSPQ